MKLIKKAESNSGNTEYHFEADSGPFWVEVSDGTVIFCSENIPENSFKAAAQIVQEDQQSPSGTFAVRKTEHEVSDCCGKALIDNECIECGTPAWQLT